MAFNTQHTARMATKSVAELQRLYQAKSLSSAAAAFELVSRGLLLSKRE